MLKNYLKVAFRNIVRFKTYSFINIFGLALGIACFITILLYIRSELSYDRFNKNADQIYRIYISGKMNNSEFSFPLSPLPMGPAIKRDFPEILSYTRIFNSGSTILKYKDRRFSEKRFFIVDSSFFNVFTVQFLESNSKNVLAVPNSIVITKTMAKKYFGNDDAMGKVLETDNNKEWKVTGVVEDFPENSHFHFDFLASIISFENTGSPNWVNNNCATYFILRRGTDADKFQQKMNTDVLHYIGPQIKQVTGISFEQMKKRGEGYGYFLQPLTSIHLHSHLDFELEENSDISYIYIFSLVAAAIILIACINFVNLSTASSGKRIKEVGIRKTLGSEKSQLVRQFITEAVLISLLAFFLAAILVETLLPLFSQISGRQIDISFLNSYSIVIFICFACLIGILAGSYPAFYLSSFQPIKIFKQGSGGKSKKHKIKSSLVVFQFAVSIILFICTLVIYNQLKFLQNKNLGFDKENIVIINKADNMGNQIESFREELLSNPRIINISNSAAIPVAPNGGHVYKLESSPDNDIKVLSRIFCDHEFVDTYKIKMKKGRFFSRDHPSDTLSVVINEAALKLLNLKNPLGKRLIRLGTGLQQKFNIIGVTENFNYESLHESIHPLIIHLFNSNQHGQYISARIAPGDYQAVISYLNDKWVKYSAGQPFEYNFFNQNLASLYNPEQRTSKIAAAFSILAILIACLGLLGLVIFSTGQRTKEIGIRKVVGASLTEIVILLSKELIRCVVLANIIAWPIAYYIMNNWLKNFAYRTNLNWTVFVFAGSAALIIALATVSFQTIKAAKANPVKALQYE